MRANIKTKHGGRSRKRYKIDNRRKGNIKSNQIKQRIAQKKYYQVSETKHKHAYKTRPKTIQLLDLLCHPYPKLQGNSCGINARCHHIFIEYDMYQIENKLLPANFKQKRASLLIMEAATAHQHFFINLICVKQLFIQHIYIYIQIYLYIMCLLMEALCASESNRFT